MNSTTPCRTSALRWAALMVALGQVVLFTVANTAMAQQQSKASQQKTPVVQTPPPTVQMPSPIIVTLTRPARDFWETLAQIVAPLVTLVGLVVAIATGWWSVRSWKLTYFTKEWSALMQFIQPQAKYMDRSRTVQYKTAFTGNEPMEYEMVARLCIGYLDDLYFLGTKRYIRTWFRGSVKLFAGTHKEWLEDHRDSYDKGFYEFILCELSKR